MNNIMISALVAAIIAGGGAAPAIPETQPAVSETTHVSVTEPEHYCFEYNDAGYTFEWSYNAKNNTVDLTVCGLELSDRLEFNEECGYKFLDVTNDSYAFGCRRFVISNIEKIGGTTTIVCRVIHGDGSGIESTPYILYTGD